MPAHESPYPPGPPPPPRGLLQRAGAGWPMAFSILCGLLCLVLATADLLQDWNVNGGAMPLYAALLAVATGGAVLGRK